MKMSLWFLTQPLGHAHFHQRIHKVFSVFLMWQHKVLSSEWHTARYRVWAREAGVNWKERRNDRLKEGFQDVVSQEGVQFKGK